eukprot:TRINITY_DN29339_c0_g1_i1.p1 TRINITY_DN29339_c0_g1~~TRINITY_DN29339_c0_g1_i1.p1  ORF type:complete len:771 (-),score=192.32 TRINITY_DN29339_c0_g1_i1:1606-3858(-)
MGRGYPPSGPPEYFEAEVVHPSEQDFLEAAPVDGQYVGRDLSSSDGSGRRGDEWEVGNGRRAEGSWDAREGERREWEKGDRARYMGETGERYEGGREERYEGERRDRYGGDRGERYGGERGDTYGGERYEGQAQTGEYERGAGIGRSDSWRNKQQFDRRAEMERIEMERFGGGETERRGEYEGAGQGVSAESNWGNERGAGIGRSESGKNREQFDRRAENERMERERFGGERAAHEPHPQNFGQEMLEEDWGEMDAVDGGTEEEEYFPTEPVHHFTAPSRSLHREGSLDRRGGYAASNVANWHSPSVQRSTDDSLRSLEPVSRATSDNHAVQRNSKGIARSLSDMSSLMNRSQGVLAGDSVSGGGGGGGGAARVAVARRSVLGPMPEGRQGRPPSMEAFPEGVRDLQISGDGGGGATGRGDPRIVSPSEPSQPPYQPQQQQQKLFTPPPLQKTVSLQSSRPVSQLRPQQQPRSQSFKVGQLQQQPQQQKQPKPKKRVTFAEYVEVFEFSDQPSSPEGSTAVPAGSPSAGGKVGTGGGGPATPLKKSRTGLGGSGGGGGQKRDTERWVPPSSSLATSMDSPSANSRDSDRFPSDTVLPSPHGAAPLARGAGLRRGPSGLGVGGSSDAEGGGDRTGGAGEGGGGRGGGGRGTKSVHGSLGQRAGVGLGVRSGVSASDAEESGGASLRRRAEMGVGRSASSSEAEENYGAGNRRAGAAMGGAGIAEGQEDDVVATMRQVARGSKDRSRSLSFS